MSSFSSYEPAEFLANHGWRIVLCLVIMNVFRSYLPNFIYSMPQNQAAESSRSSILREDMLLVRERQQQAVIDAAAARPAPNKPKAKPQFKRSDLSSYSHLLGQQSNTYKPARRTVKRG